MNSETIIFPSSRGAGRVSASLFTPDPEAMPRAVVQISHGMCEHMGRYEDFAAWLCSRGFVVCGNDHLGHRNTVLLNGEKLGYFGPKGSARYLVEDLERLRLLVSQRYPGLPYFLLGHSMGSFIARLYAAGYGSALTGLILSGTAGHNPLTAAGRALAASISAVKGPQYVSGALYRMANGRFNKNFPDPRTPVDWLSRDPEVCAAYCRDRYCTFQFTSSAYYELFGMLDRCNRPEWYQSLPKTLPVLLISGDRDPVGNNGAGPLEVYRGLVGAGLEAVSVKLYPGGRHEMLHEINFQEAYGDLLAWMEKILELRPQRG